MSHVVKNITQYTTRGPTLLKSRTLWLKSRNQKSLFLFKIALNIVYLRKLQRHKTAHLITFFDGAQPFENSLTSIHSDWLSVLVMALSNHKQQFLLVSLLWIKKSVNGNHEIKTEITKSHSKSWNHKEITVILNLVHDFQMCRTPRYTTIKILN